MVGFFLSSSSAETRPLSLMPMPASVQMKTGQLVIDPSFTVGIQGHSDAFLQRAVGVFLDNLGRQTAIPQLDMKIIDAAQARLVIHCERSSKAVQELGEDESYSLVIGATGAKLDAVTTLGIMRGLQTFLQMVQTTSDGFAVSAIAIQDMPRFPWRGLMIDVSRHFIPLDVLKRNLDGMAAVKLNVFHWHLSDNQGFRVESKKFPKLQEMGSDGQYYTQDEVRDLIAYAHDRGIRVVPEFDMPGHSTAWFVGYPELASAPGPYQIERKWGIFDPAMDPTQERTYKFLDALIGEMAKLFPDQFFHIGGDEVNGKQWDANPNIQAFMRAHGMKNNQDLQAYFNTRVQTIVSKHGKAMVGWDEILRPDLPKDIVVQSWRGQDSLAAAAKLGYRGLLSFGYYVDLNWPASRHYAIDAISGAAANLSPEDKQRILGGEACMWSEYVSPENIDSRLWPRTAAIAERLWSQQDLTDVHSMYQRLQGVSRWLDWLGLTHNSSYAPMLRRVAGSNDISALRTFTDVVEPVKDYTREEIAAVEATSLAPLNRVVDAARPESETARRFTDLVNALIAGQADANAKQEIAMWLSRWRDNQTKLQPLENQLFLLQEIVPLSEDLSAVAVMGLQALDYVIRGERAPDSWTAEQFALLQEAEKPKAQLLLMVAPAVQKLVEASSAPKAAPPQ
ncbi:MAG TPA: family 20 glycosylhydrolase [Terriglobales bacterium]|jgi:hexosaminidase|nr:family 20 glycosylhydrolase [Terriglobales bacterium]